MATKVTDYIIEFFLSKGVSTLFGYPGGVVCHLMDSSSKYDGIDLKLNYHEQACSFAACAYAQMSDKVGLVYATSGPGATNLVTGIANAWFDSLPVIFLTGQVDTYALKNELGTRQKGFQETEIVDIARPITKYSVQILDPTRIRYELEKAYHFATNGRKGPVLIDLPADVQRAMVELDSLEGFNEASQEKTADIAIILEQLKKAKRPVILAGAGINQGNARNEFAKFVSDWQLPVVASMSANDVIEYDNPLHFGFVGVNGHRYATMILAKSDLVLCLGNRVDLKQIGPNRNFFSDNTQLIRVEIDKGEIDYKVNDKEIIVQADVKDVLTQLTAQAPNFAELDKDWLNVCSTIKQELEFINDSEIAHSYLRAFSKKIPQDFCYSLDVGQSQVWAVQALELKNTQRLIMSAGLGSMGYALPAAIGAYYATNRPQVAIVGDGGFQMNIQELQFIAAHKLPITILLVNNKALGMIRHFQEKNFAENYLITTKDTGYSTPDFEKVVKAYGLDYEQINDLAQLESVDFTSLQAKVYDISSPEVTYLMPAFGREQMCDQEPKIDRELFDKLINL